MEQKRLFVIGVGYVGLVTSACLAKIGHIVKGVDIDEQKIAMLSDGKCPIYEEGLPELLNEGLANGRLSFQLGIDQRINDYEIVMIAVGTPERSSDGRANLYYIGKTAEQIARHVECDEMVVVGKSTVPIGTTDQIRKYLSKYGSLKTAYHVGSNPETLREGQAVWDFMNPDRIIIGGDPGAQKALKQLYEPIDCPKVVTDTKSAEMIKLVSNFMLAQRISTSHACASICEATGANIEEVMKGVGLDKRIGKEFLRCGVGFGGSCFPKDTKNIRNIALHHGLDTKLFDSVIETNEQQWLRFCRKVEKAALFSLNKKRITIWGIAFKPNTDDTREAPSLKIIQWLANEGAILTVHDPVGHVPKNLSHLVTHCEDMYEACRGAEMLLIVTEWKQYKEADLCRIKQLMEFPVILDGRNIYNPCEVRLNGFDYTSIGRP